MMKKFMLVCLAAFGLLSCEDVQDNTPAMQGVINDVFFRANDARANKNDDGTYVLQGYTQDEIMTLRVISPVAGVYELGGDSKNFASFEDAAGNFYVTSPNGSGQIEITRWDTSTKTIDGEFTFTSIVPGVDTLQVHSGNFFGVQYGLGLNPPLEPDTPTNGNAGTFVASVDSADFNPAVISAVVENNKIIITGETATKSIVLDVPLEIEIGSFGLPRANFQASHIDVNGVENAVVGNIIIIGHDEISRRIKGTFSFETENHTINIGQFNVVYSF